jgi:O-antigen ligase/Flp pilus assembly protein TadD
MTEPILRRAILILGALALVSPFIVAGDYYFPFITGKGFFFRTVVEVMVALYVVLVLAYPRYRPTKSIINYSLLGIVVAGLVAVVFSVNPEKSLWSNFERMEGFVAILHYALYAFVLGTVLTKENHWNWLFRASLTTASIIGFYGLIQVVSNLPSVVAAAPQWSQTFPINQGGVRLDGTFGNAAYLAVYALIHIFLGAWFIVRAFVLRTLTKLDGALGIVAAALSLLALYFSATRGAFLGLAVGILVLLVAVAFGKGVTKKIRKTALAVVVVGALIGGGLLALRDTPFIKNDPTLARITSISFSEGTTRFTLWNMALQGFAEKPVFGWGFEGFNQIFYKHYQPDLYAQEPWFDRAHNVFLDWLVAGGIVGLVAYLSLYGAALYAINRRSKLVYIEKAVLTGLVVAYGINNIFIFDNLGSYLMFFTLLGYLQMRRGKQVEWKDKTIMKPSVSAPIALILCCAVWWGVNANNMAAASTLRAALASPDLSGVTQNMLHALNISSFGKQEVFEQALQAIPVVAGSNLPQSEKVAFISSVIDTGDKLMAGQLKGDARVLVLYGSTLRTIGENAKAKEYLTQALSISPNKQIILFEYTLNELSMGSIEGGLAAAKKAFEIEPKYDDARTTYAAALIFAGNTEEADRILIERFGTTAVDNGTLLSVYVARGFIDRAIVVARTRVDSRPTDPEAYLFLASLLNQSGKRAEAISVLTNARTLFPQFKNEFTTLITTAQNGGTF